MLKGIVLYERLTKFFCKIPSSFTKALIIARKFPSFHAGCLLLLGQLLFSRCPLKGIPCSAHKAIALIIRLNICLFELDFLIWIVFNTTRQAFIVFLEFLRIQHCSFVVSKTVKLFDLLRLCEVLKCFLYENSCFWRLHLQRGHKLCTNPSLVLDYIYVMSNHQSIIFCKIVEILCYFWCSIL